MARADDRRHLLDNAISSQNVMVADRRADGKLCEAESVHHALCVNSVIAALQGINLAHTFTAWNGFRWKGDANTSLATFSKPSADARPIKVMGESLFTNRVRLRAELLAAFSHIRFTNETGSIGAIVLKNITDECQPLVNLRDVRAIYRTEHQLARE